MKSAEQRQREMLYEQPYEKWPLFAKAMGWERTGPSWMTPSDREWFWREVDYATAKAEEQAARDKAWADLKDALIAPFLPLLDWLARRLG